MSTSAVDTGQEESGTARAATGVAAAAGGGVVDAQHPWLGLASFTEATRAWFFGREDEVAELARRVQRKLLTILFGQSGLGKTSILRAGIVPRLRRQGYCPVYVRIDYSRDAPAPAEQIKQAIVRETRASGEWTQTGVAASGESLWEFLHHRDDVLRDQSGAPLIPLLIFDQFEEVFTLAQSDEAGRRHAAQFIEDLADLVENRAPRAVEALIEQDDAAAERFDFARADYRILIALREDYLAHLEGLKGKMPSITQNRMRLGRMTGAQALAAVRNPGGSLVSEEVAEAIVRFVAGGPELANAEVEPSLLSLICRELNNARIAQGREEISADLLAGSRDTILSEFYERALADQPAGVRQVIEDNLLTESGYRESLAEERLVKQFAAAGAPPGTLATLVDRRLLRIEERLDVRRVELTHDVLCGVVKASRDLRLERVARDEAERQVAAQRERERTTRAALVRARKIAGVCAALALAAVASALFGYVNMRHAREAEARAEETRLMAEQARGESEKLVVYLLDDFYVELAPVGRLDIVGGLAKRALQYYDSLPPALRTPQTERNRALALVRYGAVLRTESRLEEGQKVADEAVKVLGNLRDGGDASEATAIGLALGLTIQARLSSSAKISGEPLPVIARAVEVMKPFATAPNASAAARRVYGEVLILDGFLNLGVDRNEAGVASLEAARATLRSIDGLGRGDLAAAALYAEATSWEVQAFNQMGRGDDALRVGQEALDVSKRVLDIRPGHMQALRAQALATSPLAAQLVDDMRTREALAMAETTEHAWRDFVRMDPGNTISWANLGVAQLIKQAIEEEMGRPDEQARTLHAALNLEREAPANGFLYNTLAFLAGRLARLEANRGDAAQAAQTLATQARLSAYLAQHAPAGSFQSASRSIYPAAWQVQVASLLGDDRHTLELGRALMPRLEQLRPEGQPDRLEVNTVERIALGAMAQAAYALQDYAAADRAMTQVLQLRSQIPTRTTGDRREAATEQTMAALVLARLDRPDDARKLLAPALQLQRELVARNHDDALQRAELATALYVSGVIGGSDARSSLAEAQALMDKLPPAMRALKDIATWRERIAAEKVRRHET